jgi:uncharacterized C2H2 Zn-finger protein
MNEGYPCEFCKAFFRLGKDYDKHILTAHYEEEGAR